MRDLLVYVAGPISKGNLADNIEHAHRAGLALLKAKIPAIVPHGSCFWGSLRLDDLQHGTGDRQAFAPEMLPCGTAHSDWYGMDLAIVRRCDAILRLPGESAGADMEVAEAGRRGIPVFGSVEEVVAWAER